MSRTPFVTGLAKGGLYARIAVDVAARYARRRRALRWSPREYLRFLRRALQLLLVFRHNKVVRTASGSFKLHLYLPAWPSPAFDHALDSKLVRRPPAPTTVVFSMTKACRYRCAHCYQRLDRGADLDDPLLLAAARTMQEAGVALFDIEGGEPLSRFPRLLALLGALDPRAECWINTTGDGLTDDHLRALRDARLFGVMVSLHSPDPATHDAMTAVPGSFAVAAEALRRFKAAGFVTAVNSVLPEAELRADGLGRLMNLARALHCDFVQLIHPKPAGLWLSRQAGMQTDPDLIARVRREHVRYNSARAGDYPSLAAQVFEESPRVLGCTAGGVDRFYLNAHGEVQPCEFLNLSFGNVAAEPFDLILARMRDAFRTPACDWLCCTQAGAIADAAARHRVSGLPLPWPQTRELISSWSRGRPTPIYRRLGIYDA